MRLKSRQKQRPNILPDALICFVMGITFGEVNTDISNKYSCLPEKR